MAVYLGLQSVLNAALGEYRNKGFRLVESDDHVLKLYHQDELVGILSQRAATGLVVQATCREFLDRRASR